MADSGVQAILVKVAAMGLKASHLGRTIGEMYPLLCELVILSRVTTIYAIYTDVVIC